MPSFDDIFADLEPSAAHAADEGVRLGTINRADLAAMIEVCTYRPRAERHLR